MKYALVSAFALFLSCSFGSLPQAATPAPRKRQAASTPHTARPTTPPKVVAAPAARAAKKAPMKVKFGLYVTHLFDINFVKNQFKIQFWSWFHLGDRKYKPNKTTELMNARTFSRHMQNEEFVKGIHWDTAVIKADIKQQWKVKKFPFDTQYLKLHLEDINLPVEKLQLVPDAQASKIAAGALPQGWKLKSFQIRQSVNRYPTAFGDPAAKSNTQQNFSRLTVTIALQRKGWRLFFTTFTGFFVASALVLIVFFVNSFSRTRSLIPLTTIISLCTGALFAAVGGIYVLSSQVAYTTEFTFADSILISTFVGIALAIAGSMLGELLDQIEKTALAATVNRVLLVVHVLLCTAFPAWAFFS